MFFQEFFAGWLSSAGWHVSPPSAPDPHATGTMTDALRKKGFSLFAPGVDLPVPPITLADARAVLVSQHGIVVMPGEDMPEPSLGAAAARLRGVGATILMPREKPQFDLDVSLTGLRDLHYTILQPEQPPALGFWVPSDGHPLRLVRGWDGDMVTYGCEGRTHTIKIKSFHKWRHERKAVHREVL